MNKFILGLFLFLTTSACFAGTLQDDFITSSITEVHPPIINTNYNYENTTIVPIKLKILKGIKSEKDLYEGQIVEFKLSRHIIYKGKIITKRETIVPAKVGMIITSGMNGIPASVVFENFEIPNIKQNQLTNSYEFFGQDRSLLVFPLKWALTFLPPTGSLTNFIKGGHTKISPQKEITLYYHPNWE